MKRRKERKRLGKIHDDAFLEAMVGTEGTGDAALVAAGLKPDTYLSDDRVGNRIDDTAIFRSKFKPAKGEITEKYKPTDSVSVVPVGAGGEPHSNDGGEINLYGGNGIGGGGGGGFNEGSQVMGENSQLSFGGVGYATAHDSGLVPANYDEQAPVPVSVKRYGGGGTYGTSRPMRQLPPLGPRPDGQPSFGSPKNVQDQIQALERNITDNLQDIIAKSIEKSSLHAKRKAARRRHLRAHGGSGQVVPVASDDQEGSNQDNQDYIQANDRESSAQLSAERGRRRNRKAKRLGANGEEIGESPRTGPGLSARDGYGESDRQVSPDVARQQAIAAGGMGGMAPIDFESKEDRDRDREQPVVPMLGQFGPGATKPVPLGEEFIERAPRVKKKPPSQTQFPSWH